MIHLRLTVPDDLLDLVVSELNGRPEVAHLMTLPQCSLKPPGSVLLCDVARGRANDVVEWLQDQGVHHRGSITMEHVDAVVSDAAQQAEEALGPSGEDTLVWEEIEAQARDESELTASFLIFIAIAAVIALVGIILDSPILIVAAMVVGPEYGPIAAICVSAARARWKPTARALMTLLTGLTVGALAAALAAIAFHALSLAPEHLDISKRTLTAFIAQPDALGGVVAALAGVIGMLSFTESRSNALVGVLVSVTTVPAVANAGASAAYAEWEQVRGSAIQLGINVAGLLLFGLLTVKVQSWYTERRANASTL